MPAISGTDHARSQSNRSRRLAEGYLTALGLVMLQAEPGLPDLVRLTVVEKISLKNNRWNGRPYWLRSVSDADALLREIIASEPKSSRQRRGVLINLTQDQSDSVVRQCAKRRLLSLAGPVEMAEGVERIIEKAEEISRRMNRTGELKALNREYAELRQQAMSQRSQMSRSNVPSYSDWIDSKVGEVLNHIANLVHFTHL